MKYITIDYLGVRTGRSRLDLCSTHTWPDLIKWSETQLAVNRVGAADRARSSRVAEGSSDNWRWLRMATLKGITVVFKPVRIRLWQDFSRDSVSILLGRLLRRMQSFRSIKISLLRTATDEWTSIKFVQPSNIFSTDLESLWDLGCFLDFGNDWVWWLLNCSKSVWKSKLE